MTQEIEEHPEKWFIEQMNKLATKKNVPSHSAITDAQLVDMFESSVLPLMPWDHYGRLRIVHYALTKYGFDNTIDQNGWLCSNWKKYKKTIGHEHLWNYTLTRFWIEIVEGLRKNHPMYSELYQHNPKIHNGNLHKEFYTNETLFSQLARDNWIPPTDLNKFGMIF
jgi:hypothetical protein